MKKKIIITMLILFSLIGGTLVYQLFFSSIYDSSYEDKKFHAWYNGCKNTIQPLFHSISDSYNEANVNLFIFHIKNFHSLILTYQNEGRFFILSDRWRPIQQSINNGFDSLAECVFILDLVRLNIHDSGIYHKSNNSVIIPSDWWEQVQENYNKAIMLFDEADKHIQRL